LGLVFVPTDDEASGESDQTVMNQVHADLWKKRSIDIISRSLFLLTWQD
jgi:hypothetical protein